MKGPKHSAFEGYTPKKLFALAGNSGAPTIEWTMVYMTTQAFTKFTKPTRCAYEASKVSLVHVGFNEMTKCFPAPKYANVRKILCEGFTGPLAKTME
jgi:hypothetical protein